MLVWTLDSCRLTQPNVYEPTVLSALFFQRILFPDASQRKASPVGQVLQLDDYRCTRDSGYMG